MASGRDPRHRAPCGSRPDGFDRLALGPARLAFNERGLRTHTAALLRIAGQGAALFALPHMHSVLLTGGALRFRGGRHLPPALEARFDAAIRPRRRGAVCWCRRLAAEYGCGRR